MSVFEQKSAKPMLIGAEGEAFDSDDHIYELKLDGARCLAYLDANTASFYNKRNINVTPIYPELTNINKQVKKRCILDGELLIMHDGMPDFDELKRRAIMTNKFKIELAAAKLPVTFTAFDIIYIESELITNMPLMDRKSLLSETVTEGDRLAVSKYIERNGTQFYRLVEQKGLEGIVAKRKGSLYKMGERTKDWVKIKNLKDEDFVVLGYLPKESNVTSILLGQYGGDRLVYKGHVTLGVSSRDFEIIKSKKQIIPPEVPPGNENAVFIEPDLVCTVKFMEKTRSGMLRQPVFKGLRDDKHPKECTGN